MVNGFQVSVHSIDERMPYLGIGGFLLYDLHEFQQLLFAPLRLLYWWSPRAYSSDIHHHATDGSHHYVDLVESLQLFVLPSSNEEVAVNAGSWSLPMLELRIPLLLVLVACDMTERLVVAVSKAARWQAFCFLVIVVLSIGRATTRKYKPPRRRTPTAAESPKLVSTESNS